MQPAMSSTPLYTNLNDVMPTTAAHLMILQDANSINAQQLGEKFQQVSAITYLSLKQNDAEFNELFSEIKAYLMEAHIGLRAVICGDEYFLWQVQQQLFQHGLNKAEIALIKNQSDVKRIYCVHCFHLFISTADEFCDCPQCATHLFIRSHFSERLGAYMAVCADAEETKGEIA